MISLKRDIEWALSNSPTVKSKEQELFLSVKKVLISKLWLRIHWIITLTIKKGVLDSLK